MLQTLDIASLRFRVMGFGPRKVSRNDDRQKMTPASDGGRPIWSVRLLAIDETRNSTRQIFVEVAGDMPQLVVDQLATVHDLRYVPWAAVEIVDGKPRGKIMDAYRAASIVMADASKAHAA
jgi:hypothetical protein